jgi:Dolichyl-phosphate-mannose-protein mannosyltransferase
MNNPVTNRGPLTIPVLKESDAWSLRLSQATWAFLAFGLAIRMVRYLLRFPLWPDESFLAANFISSGYMDLLGALGYHQVAPLLFVWVELFVVKLLGFSEYSLRLFPFLGSLVSLCLFYHLCRRLLKGAPLLLAVAIFAVAYFPIRHGAEVKPYAIDLLVSLVLLTLAVEWWRAPSRGYWLWWLAAVVPFAIGLSFPAIFIAGGVSIGLAGAVLTGGRRSTLIPYAVYNLALVGGFLLVFTFSTGPQYKTEKWLSSAPSKSETFHDTKYKTGAWQKTFPPLKDPLKLAWWMVDTHTGHLFSYPNGGRNGGSTVTFICFVVGAVVLWSRKRKTILAVLLAPFGLALIAAALHRYPYGYVTRFNLYLGPMICLLAGLGAAKSLSLIRNVKLRTKVFIAFAGLLALVGAGMITRDLIHPFKNPEDQASRRFARWLWKDKAENAELICVRSDLGKDFFPRLWEWGYSARYLCNQAIYSPSHRQGGHTPRWNLISPTHPLRCVVFSVPENIIPRPSRDEAEWSRWLAEMKGRYDLVGREKYEVNPGVDGQHDIYEIYEFIPKNDTPSRSTKK